MKIILNGQPNDLPADQTVAQLVAAKGLVGRAVAVEINRQIVPRREHDTHTLQDGDEIEIVTLVGGG